MANGLSKPALREIRALFTSGTSIGLSDPELIERFLSGRGEAAEAAFAALVGRHGPMVLGVCRRALGDLHDAEDAFQATFLVLVRRAAAIGRRELLGPWLHGVAVRTASEARTRAARRRAKERHVNNAHRAERTDLGSNELRSVLDEELNRLPETYRRPLILCELEGLARKDAAKRLGIPEGTLSSRLSRGRALLRERLTRRGLAVSTGALAVALTHEASAVAVSEALADSTIKAVTQFAAGFAAAAVSGTVATLTEGVLKTMFLSKLRLFAVTAVVGVFVTSAVVVGQQDAGGGPPSSTPGSEQASTARQLRALESKLDRVLEALAGSQAGSSSYRERVADELGTRYPVAPPKNAPYDTTVATEVSKELTRACIERVERRVERVERRLDEMSEALDRLNAQGPFNAVGRPKGVGKPSAGLFGGAAK